MEGDIIPDPDHVARYCKPLALTEDRKKPIGVAFLPRSGEAYLSVNWLESLGQRDCQEQLAKLRKVFEKKGFHLAATGKLAVLNVGKVVAHVRERSEDGRKLAVVHQPVKRDPSHSGILGYRHEDMAIASLIAEVVEETYPARG